MLSRTLLLALVPLTACGVDEQTDLLAPQFSKGNSGGGGGGSSNVTYGYTMTGDIATPTGSAAPTLTAKATPSFTNISLSGFSIELGAPTGAVTACQTGSGQYEDTFLTPNLNRTWLGTLKVAKNGTLSFLGSDAGETLQLSVADATGGPTQTAAGNGVYVLAYTDARLFFGSNSTHYDGKYRCVNLALVATAQ